MSRCGNKAIIQYEVSGELVGKVATVEVQRKGNPKLTASVQAPLPQTKNKIPWPDLADGKGSYYGGRQVDWMGLDKCSYETKFKHQKFELRIVVAGKKPKTSGQRVEIQAYANKGPDQRKVGLPMDIYQGPAVQTFNAQGQPVLVATSPDSPAARANWVATGSGCFNLQFKDGEVLIRIKLNLVKAGTSTPVKDEVFKAFKRSVESFWNDRGAGFRQWVFHRVDCLRGDQCNCSVLYKNEGGKKEQMLHGGCCKFPSRVVIEHGNDNTVNVTFLTKAEILQYVKGSGQWPGAFNTQNICYPEDVTNSYAHEVGHMMGLPDEYNGPGSYPTLAAASPSPFPVTPDSIMGSTMQRAYQRHLEYPELFADWVSSNVTKVKVIPR